MCALLQCASLSVSLLLLLLVLTTSILSFCFVCILLEYLFDDIIVLLDPHWSWYMRACVCMFCYASMWVFVVCAHVCSLSFSFTFFVSACGCVYLCIACLFIRIPHRTYTVCIYTDCSIAFAYTNTARVCVFYLFVAFFVWFSLHFFFSHFHRLCV